VGSTLNGNEDIRARLGIWLVFFSAGALVILAIVMVAASIWKGDASTVKETTQLLLSSLLPLFGTWVGTVLAFYFSKENFEAANRGTIDLVRSVSQRLASTKVTEAMMTRVRMIVLEIPQGKTLDDVSISEIMAKFEATGGNGQRISRLPILTQGGACAGFLHRGVWAEMLANALSKPGQTLNVTTGALGPLLDGAYPLQRGRTFREFIGSAVAFVARDRTVAEAKALMEQSSGCQDVIVTDSGKRDEPVLGWISNIDIGRLSQA